MLLGGLVALALALAPAYSQTFGEISGVATDSTGAVIAGARVTITNAATGAVREVETNEAGNYNVPFLNPGIYNLTAEIEGFKAASVQRRQVQVGEVAQRRHSGAHMGAARRQGSLPPQPVRFHRHRSDHQEQAVLHGQLRGLARTRAGLQHGDHGRRGDARRRLLGAAPYDFSGERGHSQFHTGQRLTASILYELPFRFDNGFANAALRGWQVGSILTFSSGTPRNHGDCGNVTFGGGGRADATGINPNDGPGTAQAFWSKGADGRQSSYSCDSPTLPYRYGNSARNDLVAPGYANWDFSLTKPFSITERVQVQFRFESFNFSNHPNWNPPSTSLTSTNYGVITSARDMRTNQFGLKLNF